MKFGHLEIYVSNVGEAARFYQQALGFEVTVEASLDLIWLKSGETEVLLRKGTPAPRSNSYEESARGIVIYTDNLESAACHLKDHDVEIRGQVDTPDCLSFTDPDGNWFQLTVPEFI